MNFLGHLAEAVQSMAEVMEEFQAQCQGMELEITESTYNASIFYPTLKFNPKYVISQFNAPRPKPQYSWHSRVNNRPTYTKEELKTKPPGFMDELLVEYTQSSKKPLGDSNLRRLRKVFIDTPKRELSVAIEALIQKGRIAVEMPDGTRAPVVVPFGAVANNFHMYHTMPSLDPPSQTPEKPQS